MEEINGGEKIFDCVKAKKRSNESNETHSVGE